MLGSKETWEKLFNYFEWNANENISYQNLWNVLREKIVILTANIWKEDLKQSYLPKLRN
jgi:hypothetical protein